MSLCVGIEEKERCTDRNQRAEVQGPFVVGTLREKKWDSSPTCVSGTFVSLDVAHIVLTWYVGIISIM